PRSYRAVGVGDVGGERGGLDCPRELCQPLGRRAHAGSLGHTFGHKARKRGNDAFVISGNADGSLKLTESRVLDARGLAHTLIKIPASVMVGFTASSRC